MATPSTSTAAMADIDDMSKTIAALEFTKRDKKIKPEVTKNEESAIYLDLHPPTNYPSENVVFTEGENVGFFETREFLKDEDFMENVKPNIILEWEEILKLEGKDLSLGYESSKKIEDYKAFQALKIKHIQKWLIDQEYFTKCSRPTFICEVEMLSDILTTPMNKGREWEMHVIKFQDIIFMRNAKPEKRSPSTIQSHAGIIYKRLVTGDCEKTEGINEFERIWTVSTSKFGEHNLMVISGGQVDNDGERVITRAYNEISTLGNVLSRKFLTYWGISVAGSAKNMVLGIRDKDHILTASKLMTSNDLWKNTDFELPQQAQCFEFAKRVLDWIVFLLPQNDRCKVLSLKWSFKKECQNGSWRKNREIPRLCCTAVEDEEERRVISELMIPNWFVDGAFTKSSS